jgi:hypothetical protein
VLRWRQYAGSRRDLRRSARTVLHSGLPLRRRLTLALLVGSLLVLPACAGRSQPEQPEVEPEARARRLAESAQREFDAGRRQDGITLATRALVVRLAHYGVEKPEPALSFVQLGDMRRRLGQLGWARQSYIRALELSVPHEKTHPAIVRLAATRLALLYRAQGDARTAERLLRRFAPAQGGAAP